MPSEMTFLQQIGSCLWLLALWAELMVLVLIVYLVDEGWFGKVLEQWRNAVWFKPRFKVRSKEHLDN